MTATVKPIAQETQTLIDAILPPNGAETSTHTDSLYDLVQPLHDIVATAQKRVADIQLLRRKADRAEQSPEVFAMFEEIKQAVEALERAANDLSHSADRLSDYHYQLDNLGKSIKFSIDTREERLANGGRPTFLAQGS